MGNERKLRLIQVAKEFKVGLNTITDFLQKKGIKSDGSPNTLVDAETYAVLEKEFGANRAAGNARESIRERISLKQTTITLEEAKKQEREEEKEVVIKSNVISVKDEIQQPKFLGKIDLSPKPKAAPAPKAEAEKPSAQHPAAPAAPAPAQAPKAAAQPAPAPAPAPAAAPTPDQLSLGQVVSVAMPEGRELINNEIGAPFAVGEPTRQTVTLTLLARLRDGDLVLLA
jgi:translation initiation factor IF-2